MPDSFHKDIPFRASPNFGSRGAHQIAGCVVHYTAGMHSIGWMQNEMSKVSAHFLIGREGDTVQLVELDKAAWHAGNSVMTYRGQPSSAVNAFTIGIELECLGLLVQDKDGTLAYEVGNKLTPFKSSVPPIMAAQQYATGHTVSGYWEPYYEPQIKALMWLLVELRRRYPQIVGNTVGHSEIAQPIGRKLDPGPLLDWRRLGRDPATVTVKPILDPPKSIANA